MNDLQELEKMLEEIEVPSVDLNINKELLKSYLFRNERVEFESSKQDNSIFAPQFEFLPCPSFTYDYLINDFNSTTYVLSY